MEYTHIFIMEYKTVYIYFYFFLHKFYETISTCTLLLALKCKSIHYLPFYIHINYKNLEVCQPHKFKLYEATPQTSRANRVRVRRALSGHVTGSSIYREGPRWYKWSQGVKQSLFYWSVTAALGESELQSSFLLISSMAGMWQWLHFVN